MSCYLKSYPTPGGKEWVFKALGLLIFQWTVSSLWSFPVKFLDFILHLLSDFI
jgi:hypothetical protein